MASSFVTVKTPDLSRTVTATKDLGKTAVTAMSAGMLEDLMKATGVTRITTDEQLDTAKANVFTAYMTRRDALVKAENEVYIDDGPPNVVSSGITDEELAEMDAELQLLNDKQGQLNALQKACIELRVNEICQGCASLNGDTVFGDALQTTIDGLRNGINFFNNIMGAITSGSSDLLAQLAICVLNLTPAMLRTLTNKVGGFIKDGDVDMVKSLNHVIIGGGGRLDPRPMITSLVNKIPDTAAGMTKVMDMATESGWDITNLHQTIIPNTTIPSIKVDAVKQLAASASGGLTTLIGRTQSKITSAVVDSLFG